MKKHQQNSPLPSSCDKPQSDTFSSKRRRNYSFLLSPFSFLLFCFLLFGTATNVNARTFYANNITTWEAAIDEINANNSGADTIRIIGNIVADDSRKTINGDVTIIGDIYPDGTPKYMINVLSGRTLLCWPKTYCTIENIKVINSNHAGIEVFMAHVTDCRIKINNCIVTNSAGDGIRVDANTSGLDYYMQQSISITNCIASHNDWDGIMVDASVLKQQNFIIDNCVCSNNERDGIRLYGENIIITNCVVTENYTGIVAYSSDNIIIDNCFSDGNARNGYELDYFKSVLGYKISNSVASNNKDRGFHTDNCQLTNCIADKNGDYGFSGGVKIIYNKCLSMNNESSGFRNMCGGVLFNSTAVNNKNWGFETGNGCLINCTLTQNEKSVFSGGKIFNSIIYGNKTSDLPGHWFNMQLYNTVYGTDESPQNTDTINCSVDDPKLQGITAMGALTNDPSQAVCFALNKGSSALGLADKSVVTKERIMEGLISYCTEGERLAWYDSIITQKYIDDILLRDQMGCVRAFSGNKYDAGAITGNFCGVSMKREITHYTPKSAANYGFGTIVFTGKNFNKSPNITLRKTGASDITSDITTFTMNKLSATFTFHNKALGKYDILIDFGDTVITFKNGFELEKYIEPEVEVELLGVKHIRKGSWVNYTIRYTNKGNTDVYCLPVIVEITTSNKVKTEIKEHWKYIYSEGIDTSDYVTINGELHRIDTLHNIHGKNNISTYVPPMIPLIPPHSTGYLTFSVKFTYEDDIKPNVLFRVMKLKPMLIYDEKEGVKFENGKGGITGNQAAMDCLEKLIMMALSLAGAMPGIGCPATVVKGLYSIAKHEGSGGDKALHTIKEGGGILLSCATGGLSGAPKIFTTLLSTASSASDMAQSAAAAAECVPIFDLLAALAEAIDPNDKIGPVSASGSTAFSDRTEFPYVINFENDEKATAPACEVWIIDTLDLKVYDINTFEAGLLTIGKRVIDTPNEQQNYTWTIDMSPEMELITKVYLQLEKTKGIATWYFKCIDPLTGEIPEDASLGFLPPNDTTGRGQGSVMFNIKLKPGLPDDVVITNRASIIFDNNKPILTPPWENKKDVVAPTSAMLKPTAVNDTVVTLKWNGTDNAGGSGVYRYDVYMKKEKGEYEKIIAHTALTSAPFTLKKEVKYAFYSIATDSAGNREQQKIKPDITIPEGSDADYLPFDTYAVTKWNNTFMLNLKKLRDDGYPVTDCKWFKNNELIGEGFSYSAGSNINDKLEAGAVYFFQITTNKDEEFSSTDKIIADKQPSSLKAYPNPVPQGSKLIVEGTTQGAIIEVFNYMGWCVSRTIATDFATELTLSLPAGVYIVRSNNEAVKIVIN